MRRTIAQKEKGKIKNKEDRWKDVEVERWKEKKERYKKIYVKIYVQTEFDKN